jgi:hypothetical protein
MSQPKVLAAAIIFLGGAAYIPGNPHWVNVTNFFLNLTAQGIALFVFFSKEKK